MLPECEVIEKPPIPGVRGGGLALALLRSSALAKRACSLAWEYKACVPLTRKETLNLSDARGCGSVLLANCFN